MYMYIMYELCVAYSYCRHLYVRINILLLWFVLEHVHVCICMGMAIYIADSEEGSWYPREKLKQAEKKLQGYNSAHIMR